MKLENLGAVAAAVERRLAAWRDQGFALRLWRGDHRLWVAAPEPELADRVGWLDLPDTMAPAVAGWREIAAAAIGDGFGRAVLLGMGGSSLAPELFARTFPDAGGLELVVLDSTHPAAVAAVDAAAPLDRTLFLVSSKSGSTIETRSLFDYFWHRTGSVGAAPGRQFIAITDAGTGLDRLAAERAFRARVTAPAEVGGRFSALTPFGLLPAALLGLDPEALLAGAGEVAASARRGDPGAGYELGAALGELARAGFDKLTLLTDPRLAALPDWLEQLVAESTGKGGQGILPVAGEPPDPGAPWSDDRVFVDFSAGGADGGARSLLAALAAAGRPVVAARVDGPAALGAELYRWEVATAAAASVLGVNPFNQPDVESAKAAAQRMLERNDLAGDRVSTGDPGRLAREVGEWLANPKPDGYFAVQAFLAPSARLAGGLAALQKAIRDRTGRPATVGLGPRYLHSTGQLHKGGPAGGRFLQLTDRPPHDVEIPGRGHGFARLLAAQARGDAEALRERGRAVLEIDLGAEPEAGLASLVAAVGDGG